MEVKPNIFQIEGWIQNSCLYLALSYDVHSIRSPCHNFWGQALQKPCRDCMKTAQSSCSHHNLHTKRAWWLCNVLAGSLRLSQEPKLPSKILLCPHDQCAVPIWVPIWESCDLPAISLRATDLQFFKIINAHVSAWWWHDLSAVATQKWWYIVQAS